LDPAHRADRHQDRETREDAHPGVLLEEVAALCQHSAPRRVGRLDAKSQERERRLREDGKCQRQRRLDNDWRKHIRQNMPEDNPHIACTKRPGRPDVDFLRDYEDASAGDARKDGRVDKPDCDHRIPDPRPKHREDRNGKQDCREREEDVHHPHEHGVNHAAEVAGGKADGHAHHQREPHSDETNLERYPGGNKDAAEDIAPKIVRTEPVLL
jgi:hypothetical protein